MVDGYRVGPETARLQHRALGPEDAEAVYAFSSDPVVMRHTGEPLWPSVEVTRERLAAYPDFARHGFGRWGCVHRPDGQVIGFSGLKRLEDIGEVDLGFRFLPAYWGRGLATESALACVAFGFEVLGLERIIAFVMPANLASLRVVEKAGLRDTGLVHYDGMDVRRYEVDRS